MPDPKRVAVLISGRGSNMRSLVERAQGYRVALVASNRPEAPGLEWARTAGVATWARDSRPMPKSDFEAALNEQLDGHGIGTIALAGFMQILTPGFIARWRGRIVNIHPSLLPKYRGLDTHRRAIAAGDRVSGCSVHLVTEELDAGEVIARAEVPILAGDDSASLEQRVLAAEHELYPQALSRFVA